MLPEELAAQLIVANSELEREDLLRAHTEVANLDLAFALKEICYQAWTNKPLEASAAAVALDSLARFKPIPKIVAIAIWIRGISALTRGEHEAAVVLLDQAAVAFQNLTADSDAKHLAAQTQVAKLYALALAGDYERAIKTGRQAIAVFEEVGDTFAIGKIEHNLGNIYWRRGDYAQARHFFQTAHRRFQQCNDERQLIMVEHCLADVDSLQNDFRAAEKMLHQALARAERLEMRDTIAKIQTNLGNLALFRGRFDAALKFLEQSRGLYFELQMPHQAAIADLEIADVYLELNLLPEALEIYRRIAPEFERLKLRAEEARTRAQIGKALARLEENEEALAEFEKAHKLYQSENNELGVAVIKLDTANLYLCEKRFEMSKQLASEAESVFAVAKSLRQVLLAQLISGESERCLKNFAAARIILRNVVHQAEQAELPQINWIAHNSLGILAMTETDFSNAEKHFRRAVEIIEKLRSPLAADAFRTAFFADKLQPYYKLAEICRLNQKRISESLIWIERARARALLDLLARETSGNEITNNKKLQAKFERVREDLNWFYSRLNRPASGELGEARRDVELWQSEIRRLEAEINELVLQSEATRRKSVWRENGFDLKRLQKALGKNRVLLEFAEFNGELAVFAIEEGSVSLIENLGTADEVAKLLEAVHFQFGTLRFGTAALAKHLPQLKSRVERYLQALYNILLRPLESVIGEKNVVVVPTGNLHYIPFHALHNGAAYVLESREISFAPSASVLLSLLEKDLSEANGAKCQNALAIGFADERTPQVEAEVESLAEILPNARVLQGEAAKFKSLKEILQRDYYSILHLACHGQFHAENPLFSSLHLADGWATVREASRLHLPNSLVVLSACETGLSRVAAGEELLGLVRGFLAAGAVTIVLSLWTVNDAATAELMRGFYQNLLAGKNCADALRTAQLNLIAQNFHPYFWSPFVVTGKW